MTATHRRPGPAVAPETTVEYHCKHCKVQVISKTNLHPVLGKQHKKSCPRARNLN